MVPGSFSFLLDESGALSSSKVSSGGRSSDDQHSISFILRYRVFIKYCVFSPRIFNILRPLLRQHWAAIGCTRKWSANRSEFTLRSLARMSYMQGVGCSELGKNTIFNEYPVCLLFGILFLFFYANNWRALFFNDYLAKGVSSLTPRPPTS